MATSKISLDEGTTTNTATNTITEDEVTKHLPRSVLNTSAGVETGTAASPIEVSLANTAANATAILVDGSDVTQPISGTITANAGTGTFSANVTVLNPTSTVTANAGTGTFTAHITSWPGIVGTVADNATTPGAPVMVGGKAVAVDGTDPTAVSEDDVAILRTDLNRRLLVSDIHPGFGTFTATYTAAMTDAELVAAPGEGLSLHVTDIVISNGATAGSVSWVSASEVIGIADLNNVAITSPATNQGIIYNGTSWVNGNGVASSCTGNAATATLATTATNIAGGSNGTIPYQSASGTTAMLSAGTSGQVLQSNGAAAPTWVTPAGGAGAFIAFGSTGGF